VGVWVDPEMLRRREDTEWRRWETQVGPPHPSLAIADGHATLYAMVYLTLCFVNSVFAATRTQFPAYMGGLAAKRAFRKLITCVIHSPMLFFESTPTGGFSLVQFEHEKDDTGCVTPDIPKQFAS
jgi:hypothetical protein